MSFTKYKELTVSQIFRNIILRKYNFIKYVCMSEKRQRIIQVLFYIKKIRHYFMIKIWRA